MAIQHEKPFETEICDWLDGHGWYYTDTPPYDELYDPATALCLRDLYGWLYDTQREAVGKLVRGGAGGAPVSPVDGTLGEFAPVAGRIRDRVVKLLATDPRVGAAHSTS